MFSNNLTFVVAMIGIAVALVMLGALLMSNKVARRVGIVLGIAILVGIILASCATTSSCPTYSSYHHQYSY